MRHSISTAFAAIIAVLISTPTAAQEAPAPAPAQSAPAANPPPIQATTPVTAAPAPKGPIPYTTFQRRSQPRPQRAAATAATVASATNPTPDADDSATPGAIRVVPGLPTTPAGARLAPGEALPQAELEAFVDGVVREAMARDHIAGVAVSVVQDGQIVLKKGYGFANAAPARRVDPDRTLFRIGSISKTFTWIALMNEVNAGRIRIDAPVNLYLPERLQIRDQGFRTPVRVVNLMDHSPGFEDRALGHLFERRYERVRPLADYLRQERPRRVAAPGAVASYSNYGAGLAGEALTYVSGKPFEALIEDTILRPAGLAHTTFREPHPARTGLPAPMSPALAGDLSEGYRWTPEGFHERPFEYISQIAPAGSASSTASDMARYMLLLLNGGSLDGATVYGAKTAEAFRTPIRKAPDGVNGWRHGFIDYSLPGGYRGYGHAGATLSFFSNMVVVPSLKTGVFISTNTDTGARLADEFATQLVQQFYAPPQTFPRPGSPALKAMAERFTGYYVGTRRANGGLEKFVGLFLGGAAVRVNDDGRLVVSNIGGVKTFVPEGDPAQGRFIATDGNERLAFNLAGGRASSFQPAMNIQTYQRSGFWLRPQILAILVGLSAIAAAATIGGVLLRNRRDHRETPVQSRASVLQTTQAALWLAAFVLFAAWAGKTSDIANVMYGWPGGELMIASACAFVAAVLTLLSVVLLPAVWRGGRRVDSWTPVRKLAFSGTAVLYSLLSVVLALWGALTPWGG